MLHINNFRNRKSKLKKNNKGTIFCNNQTQVDEIILSKLDLQNDFFYEVFLHIPYFLEYNDFQVLNLGKTYYKSI